MSEHPRILIVEDDPYIRTILRELLDEEGYRTAEAEHGRAALAILRQHRPLPDLILLDLMMPIMSGPEFRQEQLRDPTLRTIPVVVVSARIPSTEIVTTIPADGYVGKPISYDALMAAVARHCRPAT